MTTWEHIKTAASHAWQAMPFAVRYTEGRPLSDPLAISGAVGMQPGGKVPVTEQNALTLSAVWAAVRILSGSIAILPLEVYRKDEADCRDKLCGDAITDPSVLITDMPNSEMTSVTFWETVLSHALTWGNGYAEIERDQMGRAIAVWPLLPNRVRPRRNKSGGLYYEVVNLDGSRGELDAADMLHLPGLGFDGLKGYSPVALARRSLGITATAEQAGEGFFAEGMRPGGVLKFPGNLQDLQKLNLEESMSKKNAGAAKFGRAMVLYGGLEYQSIGIPPDDAQFLETRQFQTIEIARWFSVPPHLLRDLQRATFSNIEQQGQDFVTYSLIYWLTKITQEFKRKILAGRPQDYAEHTLAALLKGDTIARYTAYGMGRQWGLLSSNDCRKLENLSPRPGGDDYLTPTNMAVNGTVPTGIPRDANQPMQDGTDQALIHRLADSIVRFEAAAVQERAAGKSVDWLEVAVEFTDADCVAELAARLRATSSIHRQPVSAEQCRIISAEHYRRLEGLLLAMPADAEALAAVDSFASRWLSEEPRRIVNSITEHTRA